MSAVVQLEPEPNGAVVLEEVAAFIRRYVVLSDEQAALLALWILHTHGLDAAEAELLGHASVAITLDTYSHMLPGMGGEAADAMGKALG